MIKNGIFCKYNGLEYKYSGNMKGDILIITKDITKIDSSFIDKYNSGVYTKIVNDEDLEEIYKIRTRGKVGDLIVNVEKDLGDSYFVGTGDYEIAEKLGLRRCDKYYYEGEILKKDIVVKEVIKKIK